MENLLPEDFDGFKPAMTKKFLVNGAGGIALADITCPVTILQSKIANEITVVVDAEPADLDGIFAEIQLNNNAVVVGEDNTKLKGRRHTPRIIIYTPAYGELTAILTEHAKLVSYVPHSKAELKLSDSAHAVFAAQKFQLTTFGQSRVEAATMNGLVNATISDSSRVKLSGSFDKIKAFIKQEDGHLETTGTVYDDLYVEAPTPETQVTHSGLILGKKLLVQSKLSPN